MPSQKVYASTADPTWDVEENDGSVCKPGLVVQFDVHDQLGIATGDLARDGGAPDLPTLNVRDFLPLPEGWDPDAQSEPPYKTLSEAIEQAIQTAYEIGLATPRYVWLSRRNANEVITAIRRGRNYACGADE